jgi:hypothetical protein
MVENPDRLGVRVLLKPFHIDDLLTALAEVLTAKALIDDARDAGDLAAIERVGVQRTAGPVFRPASAV